MPENTDTARQSFSLPPLWRRRLSLLGGILAALFTVYTLAGFFLAPYLISRYAPQYAEEQLQAKLHLGKVRVNPLLFSCEAEEISLQSNDEAEPLLSVQRFFVDLELESLFRRAWTIGELVIDAPALHLVTGTDGRLNLATLIERRPKTEPPPESPQSPPRLLLKHLTLSGGTVRIVDRSKTRPTETTVTPIAFAFNNISTIPEHRGTYTVSAALPGNGTLGWQGEISLEPLSSTGTIELKDFKPAALWNLFRDRLNLAEPAGTAQLTAGYVFSSRNGESALRLNPIHLEVRGLTLTEQGAPLPLVQLESLVASNGQIDFVTHQITLPSVLLKDGRLTAKINKDGVGNWQRLAKTTPKAANAVSKPVSDEGPPWRITMDSFSATGLGLRYNDASGASPIDLAADLGISLSGGTVDLGRQEVSAAHLALTGGITYSKNADSRNTATTGHDTRPASVTKTSPQKAETARKQPWKVALKQFDVSGFHLGFADRKNTPPVAYDLTGLNAQVKDLGSSADTPVAFEAQGGIGQGGSVRLNGTIAQAGGQLGQIDAQVGIKAMNLKPLASLITEHAALALVSGDFSANTHLRYDLAETPAPFTLAGETKIEKLRLNEEQTGARFLAWKELAASGVDFGLNPDQLRIKEVKIQEPGAKITIFQDKSVNLTTIRKAKPATEPENPEKPPFPVEIERIRLKNGVVDFADLSLVMPFATRITEFKGGANGISSKPNSRASLKFAGRVGEFGQAKAAGSLVPSNPKQFTDIKVTFRNVAMSPLSPYSATFAGRTIASGKLNLDLGYNIKESELLGENSVILEDFTLGERVESPSAMDLPLDLAIALLTDSEGKINVAVPISGNVDHPEFSYGHIIRQALFNLLSNVVTSPFRALGALFGTDSKNMDAILFEPGRAELSPPEQEKLKNMAEVLGKREKLQLIVHGGFDPALDGKALKISQFRRTLVQKYGVQRGPMAYDNAKTQRALEKLAGNKLIAFQASYEENTGQKVKRVNPALALLGKASEDCAFYQALFDYLVETTPLPQAELESLAEQRGVAIIQDLTGRGGFETTRVTLGVGVQTEAQDKGVPAKLELGLH